MSPRLRSRFRAPVTGLQPVIRYRSWQRLWKKLPSSLSPISGSRFVELMTV
ncbi:hypothetical protein [Marinobacterium sp. xm-d-420]|uniref:hypothetical protein n=1 Tax=Marinobacterium sp. xm-d-420 TaxID=2497737 RepID=UPI0015681B60|nr:hypothetical protein [Marinobacterium sp. xm-d-420]